MLIPFALMAAVLVDWSTAQLSNCAFINEYSYPCICSTFVSYPETQIGYAIECSNKKLTDTRLAVILKNLNTISDARTYLSRLDFSTNRLSRILESLGSFQNLKAINFDYNAINTLLSGSFNFTDAQFRDISLCESKIKSIEPGAFQGTNKNK